MECSCSICTGACSHKPGWFLPDQIKPLADHLDLTELDHASAMQQASTICDKGLILTEVSSGGFTSFSSMTPSYTVVFSGTTTQGAGTVNYNGLVDLKINVNKDAYTEFSKQLRETRGW